MNKIKINDNNILNLEHELNNKKEELKKLKLKILDSLNENKFNIIFISNDNKINFPISCNLNDSIIKLEEIIYDKYPEYKEYNTYLTINKIPIKRFKTIKENNIKAGNTITINIYQQ